MWCPGEEAGVVMREPEEIDAQEHDEILARVAAIDVATATGMVCSRIPDDRRPAKRTTKVWEVSATTNAIIELGDHLVGAGIERVVVESTSDYWRPFVYLLEACGLRVWLVNAHDVKNVPGRPKTDKLDAVWLAKLGRAGHAAPVVRASTRDPCAAGLHPASF
jgi:transposase